MKTIFRLLVIGFLAFAMVSCNQIKDTPTNTDTNPEPTPNPSPEPKPEPDPTNSGLAELLASATANGFVSSKLSYKLDGATAATFEGYANQEVSYLLTGLKLSTAKGNSLKALGLIIFIDFNLKLDAQQTSIEAKGELELEGDIVNLGDSKAIKALANLKIPLEDRLVDARAVLLLVDEQTFFDEADAIFVSDSTLKAKFSQSPDKNLSPFTAFSKDAIFLGFSSSDTNSKLGEQDELAFSYLAKSQKTAYGTVKQLAGFLGHEHQNPVMALAFNLKQPQAVKKVVLACDGCKEDVLVAMPRDAFTATDDLWRKQFLSKNGIPNWINGKEPIPFGKEPSCNSMHQLLGEAIYAGNRYRSLFLALKTGADLVRLSASSQIDYPIGSKPHTTVQDYLYKAINLSFTSTQTILETMDKAACFK